MEKKYWVVVDVFNENVFVEDVVYVRKELFHFYFEIFAVLFDDGG